MGREVLEQLADAFPRCLDGSLGGFSQEQFQFGEDLLDRVEIWTIGRQIEQFGSSRPDGLAHGLPFVAAKIVHDDDVAR